MLAVEGREGYCGVRRKFGLIARRVLFGNECKSKNLVRNGCVIFLPVAGVIEKMSVNLHTKKLFHILCA